MISDSISTLSVASAASTKNLGKKKKTNRSAKLKQCKIDARREQWLSQGVVIKSNGFDDGVEKLETRAFRGEEHEEEDEGSVHQDSDSESHSNSPSSVNSCTCNYSWTNFTGSCSSGCSGISSSSSSSSAGCCSGNTTEEEEGGGDDDVCLDDWEAVADALAAYDKCLNPCTKSPPMHEPVLIDESAKGAENSKPESARFVSCHSSNARAWRPDDAFRPQSLPNLSKQQIWPNHDRSFGGNVPWACNAGVPSPCPICCEDLDLTDSSFFPCPCGFRLCLFCHKRILEEDGRCPGCRKPYKCEPTN